MKFFPKWLVLQNRHVAPFAGAWIEITRQNKHMLPKRSLPSRERGLKSRHRYFKNRKSPSLPSRERGLKFLNHFHASYRQSSVAPFAGAWIEILNAIEFLVDFLVAPFAGAWIEISLFSIRYSSTSSLPSRERGLKC